MKYNLQRNGDYVRMAMTEIGDQEIYICLLRALYQIDVEHFFSWYSYCGYI
jgi:hypothetical protein